MLNHILRIIFTFIDFLRFGKVTRYVIADVAYVTSEYSFKNKKGEVIGYWAYGTFDPSLPYPTNKNYTII